MKLVAPFVLLAIAILTTLVLDGTSDDADLVLVNRADVFTLDPQRMSYTQDFRMAYALYEGLVRWNNRDFTIQPAAAGLPECSDDQRTYTFRLRGERHWSDGTPVTVHDFIYAWRRLMLPDTAADYSNLYFVIDGSRAFWEARQTMLRGFTADPWQSSDDRMHADAEAMVARLRTLLDAHMLPAAIAAPPPAQRTVIERDLDQLDALLAQTRLNITELEAHLVGMSSTRDWHRALDDRTSRTAEVAWHWARTDELFEELVGLRAIDARTLEVTLEQPCAYFLDLLAFAIGYPVFRPCVEGWPEARRKAARRSPEGWAGIDPPDVASCSWIALNPRTGRLEQRHQWARPEHLVCNGPYTLTRWRYKRDMRLERNELYSGDAQPTCDTIVVRAIEDTNTMVLAFESGSVDWLTDVTADYRADMLEQRTRYIDRHRDTFDRMRREGVPADLALAQLPAPRDDERRNIHTFPTFGTDFYSFNCRPELADGRANPFHDSRVRRAFACSIDKPSVVNDVTRLREPVLNVFIPPGSIPGYTSPDGLSFNRDRAIDELRDAGWEQDANGALVNTQTGEPFPVVDLLYTTNTQRYKWISLELKAQWEQVLGVRIKLRGADTKFYKEDLKLGQYMIARGNWYGDYGDPTTFLELCRSTDGNNDRGYDNPAFDEMLDRATRVPDPQQRLDALAACEAFLFGEDGETPMLVLCQMLQVYMYDPAMVAGISDHPRLTQYLWQLEPRGNVAP